MEIASFEPMVGGEYEIQDMTSILRGTFLGFIQRVRGAQSETPTCDSPLMLFEIVRRKGEPAGYRYAAAHVSIFYDSQRERVRFTLCAEHFGYTIRDIDYHGPQARCFWKLIESR